ncbi:hypothetical protein LUZ60_009918 [Juncus effusus]|nr:hypothetical protein LUZ60_009918 [Juncus effusus]
MAAKRHRDDYEEEQDQPGEKKMNRLPSFSTVIREAIMVKSLENFFMAIEPHLRRVVQEEIQKGLNNSPRYIDRAPQMQIQAAEPSPLRLIFKMLPNLPIFTGSKIDDIESNPLQIYLVAGGPNGSPSSFPSPLKIELLVLDGDFPFSGADDWTSEEFNKWIVKERAGKRPLLTGDVSNVIMRDGVATIGDLQFTDNSSWIRSRNFRIAARLVPQSFHGPRIREAITDKFVVRDHRGELYKKHYPPSLSDEVWRLDKIGKDGAFHKKLSEHKINNVQGFLKVLSVDPNYLRSILGVGMSDKMWEIVINHAKTCDPGEKIFIHAGQNVIIYLNSICQIVSLTINGVPCSLQSLSIANKTYVQQLLIEAYQQWNTLREVDSIPNPNIALIQSETVIQQGGVPNPWNPEFSNSESGITDFQIGGLEEEGPSFQVAYTGSFHFNPYN